LSNSKDFEGIREFRQWLYSGGEGRAGLPRGSLTNLATKVDVFSGSTDGISDHIDEIARIWADAKGDNSLKASLQEILLSLHSAGGFVKQSMPQAATVQIEVIETRKMVGSHMSIGEIKIVNLKAEIQNNTVLRGIYQTAYDSAVSELKGSKRFWNDFLHGLTFTAYNPVQEAKDKAAANLTQINALINSSNQKARQLQDFGRSLEASNNCLGKITNLSGTMTDFRRGF